MNKVVAGIYRDQERITHAVETLMQEGVPVDEISVVLRDSSGRETRRIEVHEATAVGKAAWRGGAIGASLGGLGVVLVGTGIAIAPGITLAAAGPILAGMVAGGATAGMAMGAPWGLGHWDGLDDVPKEELDHGTALIAVHSRELADTAKRVLSGTGATVVTEAVVPS